MCTSHLEDWSSLLTEQCGDGKEDLEAMWRCSSSVQCAEIVFVSGSGERVGAIGMAFSDHISRNRFHGSEHMTCWSFHFNLATYLCMGLPSKFTFPCRCSIWFYSFDAGFEKSDDKMDMEEWVTKVWARSEDRNENCVLGELQ